MRNAPFALIKLKVNVPCGIILNLWYTSIFCEEIPIVLFVKAASGLFPTRSL